MNPTLYNDFNSAADRLSQYVSTKSPNIDFVRGKRGIMGRTMLNIVRSGFGRGGNKFERGGGRFGRGGRNGRGGRGGCGGRRIFLGRVNFNYQNYNNNNRRRNHNHGVDLTDITRNFSPEEVIALVEANIWDDVCAQRKTKRRRMENGNNNDISIRINALSTTLESLADSISQINQQW